jgi:hypothetical protein
VACFPQYQHSRSYFSPFLLLRLVAPEILVKALEANLKMSRFGIRELERVLFDYFAGFLAEARSKKMKAISFDVDSSGAIVCRQEKL